ncbi:hypothetical protein CN217_26525 [Sinorhizobium meliloti]|uniref:hypothetical protein n=1 Tax=Rhizobium meliloti TaxID=382 RepID=UPI000FD4D037|nr:hypothetical protein [Sinorhizobium meliloti]RVH05059.1 hypothetical protein CN217_26525 [Sinorhizobium meliloti]
MITATQLRDFAYFLSNTSRWELEKAGIIAPGPSGDTAWKRFNNDFDVFAIKLPGEKLTALTDMINGYLQVSEHSREQAANANRRVGAAS